MLNIIVFHIVYDGPNSIDNIFYSLIGHTGIGALSGVIRDFEGL